MSKLSLRLVCQIYLLLLLLAAAVLSSLPYSPLALVLLLVVLGVIFRPLPPRFNITLILAVMFLLPLLLSPSLDYLIHAAPLPSALLQFVVALSFAPAIYLLDYALRQYAQETPLVHGTKWRYMTPVTRALLVVVLAMLLVSAVIDNRVLLFTAVILAGYLLFTLIRVLRGVSWLPLDISPVWKRIIAGTSADISLHAAGAASMRLYCRLTPVDPWVRLRPQRFALDEAGIELGLTVTPPLSGPSMPKLRVSVTDPRGFVQVNQIVEPVELHVIPRAKYAEWLALRYLEQTGGGVDVDVVPVRYTTGVPKRGVEYFDSRAYQPGDQLRDIDWKHTLKLGQLIVKECILSTQQAAIIAVNLSVSDAEEADKLAFNLITTALTLARETIPAALGVYDHEKVVLTTIVTHPRETLKQTLSLVKAITPIELAYRYLQPPDVARLRRDITRLRQATSEPAQRLLAVLNFEYRALEEAAKNHSATATLLQVAGHVTPPALIVSVSQQNHDAEALLVTTQKLAKRGFTTLQL